MGCIVHADTHYRSRLGHWSSDPYAFCTVQDRERSGCQRMPDPVQAAGSQEGAINVPCQGQQAEVLAGAIGSSQHHGRLLLAGLAQAHDPHGESPLIRVFCWDRFPSWRPTPCAAKPTVCDYAMVGAHLRLP
jgi:hypothetical protein